MTATDADLIKVFWAAALSDDENDRPFISDERGDGTEVRIDTAMVPGINLARGLRAVIAQVTPSPLPAPQADEPDEVDPWAEDWPKAREYLDRMQPAERPHVGPDHPGLAQR